MLRFHIPLVEPDVRISHIRLSDGCRFQAHAACAAQATSPENQACSGVASSFFGGFRLAPLSRPLSPSQTCPKSGPFPPPALPGIISTTGMSATPYGPACPSRAAGWCLPTTAGASRVASDLLVYACRRQYTGGTVGCARCCLLQRRRSSLADHRVGSRIAVFEACSAFTARYGLHTRGGALRPFTPEASAISLPTSPLRLLPTEATLVGWDFYPLKIRAFSRRTISGQPKARPLPLPLSGEERGSGSARKC